LEVPYNIDICELKEGVYKCDKNTPISLRKERIKSYLKEKIIDIL